MVDEGRLVRVFENIARIYSPSYKERAMADYIKGYVEALGFLAFEDDAGSKIGGDAGNLIVTIPATTDGPSVLFASHMDTVEPSKGVEPFVENGVIRSKGDTILGADDKAGVTGMLELVSILAEDKSIPHGPIHLVFTVAEEVGLHGAKELDLSDKRIDYAYVLDNDLPVGNIITSAPYQDSFSVEYRGKAAHAGVAPERGINAILAVSKAICCMTIGRIDDETTANVGMIEGGVAGNIVPENVKVFAEARSINLDKLEAQANHMLECFNKGARETGAKVSVKRTRPYEGFKLKESDAVVKRVMNAVSAIGLTPKLIHSGGGSDTNVFNSKGVPAANLSMGAEDVHTTHEHVPVAELVNLAKLLVEVVRV